MAGVIARITLGLMHQNEVWQTVFADDLKITAHGRYTKYEDLVLSLLIWCLVGTPSAWLKTRGGLRMEWLGYRLDYVKFEAGVTEKRAQWFVKWITETLEAKS